MTKTDWFSGMAMMSLLLRKDSKDLGIDDSNECGYHFSRTFGYDELAEEAYEIGCVMANYSTFQETQNQ